MTLWPWMNFFFQSHHIFSWRLSYVTLLGHLALSCFRHLHFTSELGFSDTACDSCCENLFLMQKNQNLGSSVRASRPFYFLQFQALTFKHCSSFSCPNTFLILFDLLSSLLITEDTVRFQNHFLKSCGRTHRSSRSLNCFWIICGRFQAIKIFGKALVTVSMITMFWFQFLWYLVQWIFHSIL